MRSADQCRKLLSNQRPAQLWRTHSALRLLCQLERKSQQLWTSDARSASRSRRGYGYGGFASLIFNPNSKNQFRVVGSLRQDYYQIPLDPDPNSIGNQNYPSYGLRDAEREPDGYATFSWVHTFSPNTLLTISPFYHHNGADYHGGANDFPVISTVTQTADYGGMQAAFNTNFKRNDLQAGVYGFAQHQHNFFFN